MNDQHNARGITLSKTWAGLTHITGLADPVTACTITGYLDRYAGRHGPEDTDIRGGGSGAVGVAEDLTRPPADHR